LHANVVSASLHLLNGVQKVVSSNLTAPTILLGGIASGSPFFAGDIKDVI
jgi:hypothetical protein